MKMLRAAFFVLAFSFPSHAELIVKHFPSDVHMIHLPKTGGVSRRHTYALPTQPHACQINNASHIAVRADYFQNLVKSGKATAIWLRDPLKRTVSTLVFTHVLSRKILSRGLKPGEGLFPGEHNYTQNALNFFSQFAQLNLTKLSEIKKAVKLLKDPHETFWPGCNWPLLAYEEYFCPPGMDNKVMNAEKADQCVNYALENINFFGVLDENKDSLKKMALAYHMDPSLFEDEKHLNKTKKNSVKIDLSNSEIKAYFDELLMYEYIIHNKLLEAQRWKIAVPYGEENNPNAFAITQYTLPAGFDPDAYFLTQATEDQRGMADIWEKRKWAMLHYIQNHS